MKDVALMSLRVPREWKLALTRLSLATTRTYTSLIAQGIQDLTLRLAREANKAGDTETCDAFLSIGDKLLEARSYETERAPRDQAGLYELAEAK